MKALTFSFMMIIIGIVFFNLVFPSVNIQVESNVGIYIQRLPNVTFYQDSIPVLFRIKTNFMTPETNNCSRSICNEFASLCMYYKRAYFAYVNESFLEYRKIRDNDRILFDDGDLFDFKYATRNHVTRIFVSQYEFNTLIQRISERENILVEKLQINSPIQRLFKKNICSSPDIVMAVILDFVSRYEHGRSFINMCQNKKLHLDVLPLDKLKYVLAKVTNQITALNYVIAIPPEAFYSTSLVECIISPEEGLMGLHIPIIRKHLLGLSLQKLVVPPFAWQLHTCKVDIPSRSIALAEVNEEWYILFPKCNPNKDNLCLVTDIYEDDAVSIPCVKMVLKGGTTQQISKACPMVCSQTETRDYLITPLAGYQFLITHPTPGTKIICGQVKQDVSTFPAYGTVLMDVPCHCKILNGESNEVYPYRKCSSERTNATMVQVIPISWMKYEDLTISKWGTTSPRFDNVETCLNYQWLSNTNKTTTSTLPYYLISINLFLIITIFSILIYGYFYIQKQFTLYIPISEVLTRQFSKKTFRTSSEEATQEQARALPTPPVTSVDRSPGSTATTFRTMDDGYLVPNETTPHVYEIPQSPVTTLHPAFRLQQPRPSGGITYANLANTSTETNYLPMGRLPPSTHRR